MKLGIANKETWIFLEEIHQYLASKYPTQVFQSPAWPLPLLQQRLSHYRLRRRLKAFMQVQEVILFEWASELLVEASALWSPGDAALVTRLHRYEMFQWTQRINWAAVSYVILDTEAMRQKLLARTTLAPERALALPNAVPLAKTASAARPFRGRIAILANLHPRKRIYELILAFHALLQHEPTLTLHIGGPQRPLFLDYYEALHDLCHRLDMRDKVFFYGRVEDRWRWYQQMDLFVSYSYSEGMQVSPIEAAASGCYCLTHGWAGADEVFPQEQIFITEADFVEKALAYCRATAPERAAMRQPFTAYVERFCNLERISHELEGILCRAAAERASRQERERSDLTPWLSKHSVH